MMAPDTTEVPTETQAEEPVEEAPGAWTEKKSSALIPLLLVLVLIGFYAVFQSVFIACTAEGIGRC
jgi:hypothetical protein